MKLGKATIYYHNHEGDSPLKALKETLDSRGWISYELFDIEETEIGDWYDEIDLNNTDATKETYEKYFERRRKALIDIVKSVIRLMNVSDLTDMGLDEGVTIACDKYVRNNSNEGIVKFFCKEEVDWIKSRCNEILEG